MVPITLSLMFRFANQRIEKIFVVLDKKC